MSENNRISFNGFRVGQDSELRNRVRVQVPESEIAYDSKSFSNRNVRISKPEDRQTSFTNPIKSGKLPEEGKVLYRVNRKVAASLIAIISLLGVAASALITYYTIY